MEILVADGLSNDGTREVLRQYSQDAPQVRMIDNPGRIVSTGLNAAITAAAAVIYEALLQLATDAVTSGRWLGAQMIRTANQRD